MIILNKDKYYMKDMMWSDFFNTVFVDNIVMEDYQGKRTDLKNTVAVNAGDV